MPNRESASRLNAPRGAGGWLQSAVRSVLWATVRPLQRIFLIRGPVDFQNDLHMGIGTRVESVNGLKIGKNVYMGRGCTITCDGTIGDHVLIANGVGLLGRHDHDYTVVGKGMSSTPWLGDSDYNGQGTESRLQIGDDVWLGFGSIVLTGVSVGRGAVVAAGAIVVGDVEPYTIVGGNPARVIGSRFEADEVARHERILGLT